MIPTFFNGMIAILMAKFMLNDVPHALGMSSPPTYNSIEPYQGEPGAASTHRTIRVVPPTPTRVLGPTLTVERTSVNMKMLDDLEATWHRIESDRSYDMQSALGILKEVMGHYFEHPAVAVYQGEDLVGVAVYEVGRDKDLQIDYTAIKELASFTHKPGVGRMLVDEVIKIARENACDEVTLSHGAGAKGFYDRLGFKLYEGAGGETGTLMVYELKGGNPGHGAKWIPPEEKYRLVKRTKRGSLVVVQRKGDKATLEIPNLEDMNDISNLLNASGIKWSMQAGISKPTWEGTPAYLREPRDISGAYRGYTITFDYSDLEKVIEGRILQPLMLEG